MAELGAPFRPELAKFCRRSPLTVAELTEVTDLLTAHGTLDIGRAKCRDKHGKPTGPFSAAAANASGDHTGSSMFGSWLRDNCMIAYGMPHGMAHGVPHGMPQGMVCCIGLYLTDPDGAGCDDAIACIGAIARCPREPGILERQFGIDAATKPAALARALAHYSRLQSLDEFRYHGRHV